MVGGQEVLVVALIVMSLGTMLRDASGEMQLNHGEDEELEQRLKILNKPHVKSIQVASGEVFDCVDVNKQPALDNPLLKGHKVQVCDLSQETYVQVFGTSSIYIPLAKLKNINRVSPNKKVIGLIYLMNSICQEYMMAPTPLPHHSTQKTLLKTKSHIQLTGIECPMGTVPIRRTTKEELRNYLRLTENNKELLQKHGSSKSPRDASAIHIYRAVRQTKVGTYYGAKVSLSLFAPQGLTDNQASGALLWVADDKRSDDDDRIAVGWLVSKQYFPDLQPRLVGTWNAAGKGGCVNTLCPGFVQVHSDISLGYAFPRVSTYKGDQTYVTLEVYQDSQTHVWWLAYGDEHKIVGYWPKELFGYLANSSGQVQVGGVASSPLDEPSPEMGSGYFPDEGFGGAAYARNIETVLRDGSLTKTSFATGFVDHINCYGLGRLRHDHYWGQNFFFGGPGKCKLA